MCPLVDLEVLRSGEDLAAAGERAGEGFLAGVYSDVIDEFVLGLEGPARARAALPEAGVRGALGSTDMVHSQVSDDLLHGPVHLAASLRAL